jgi:hypothetical protein
MEVFDISVAPGTPHDELLNSNEPLDDSDLAFIQSVLSKTDAPLTRLDDEIWTLRRKLAQLEEERASLFNYRMRNRVLLCPLRRMPSELLREIFPWTLPSFREALDMGTFDMGQTPWLLT